MMIANAADPQPTEETADLGVTVARLPLTERLALSVEEAGALLGISRDLAYDLVSRGDLPSVRLGRRVVVPRFALEERLRDLLGSNSTLGRDV